MKGRAHAMLTEFQKRCSGLEGVFLMSRLILLARIVPELITPDLDDPEIEERLKAAIAKILAKGARMVA
jgi:hypothetical protein